jgi:hypothetical protein
VLVVCVLRAGCVLVREAVRTGGESVVSDDGGSGVKRSGTRPDTAVGAEGCGPGRVGDGTGYKRTLVPSVPVVHAVLLGEEPGLRSRPTGLVVMWGVTGVEPVRNREVPVAGHR